MILYVDTSALMRRYLNRKGSAETDAIVQAATLLGTSVVTRVEAAASITRLEKGGAVSRPDCGRALAALDDDLRRMWIVPANSLVMSTAYDLARAHRLKGYDAVQLGSACVWQSTLEEPVRLATFDSELWTAASARPGSVAC